MPAGLPLLSTGQIVLGLLLTLIFSNCAASPAAAQFFALKKGTPEETRALNNALGALVLNHLPMIEATGGYTGNKHMRYLVDSEPLGLSMCRLHVMTISYRFSFTPDDNSPQLLGVSAHSPYSLKPGLLSREGAGADSNPCGAAEDAEAHFNASGAKVAEQGVALVLRALAKLDGAGGKLEVRCPPGISGCADRVRSVRQKGLSYISDQCERERPSDICAKVIVGYSEREFWSGFTEITLMIHEEKSSAANPNPDTLVQVIERNSPPPPPSH